MAISARSVDELQARDTYLLSGNDDMVYRRQSLSGMGLDWLVIVDSRQTYVLPSYPFLVPDGLRR